MLRSGCASTTSGRRSSIEQTNFFFKPVQLHLEPANLFEQRFLFYLTVARLALAAVHEQLRHLLDGCLSPGADLHGVHVVLRSQLVERPLAADRLQRYPPLNFGLYCFRVVVIALSLSRPPTPKLTYCVVQILGTIITSSIKYAGWRLQVQIWTVLLSCRRHRPLPFATADSEINLLRGPNSGDHYNQFNKICRLASQS